jgi:hypothetical protein
MKKTIFLFALMVAVVRLSAQSIYPIRTDTLKVYTGSITPGAGAELLLQNASRTVLNGVLTNVNGRGNTVFRNLALSKTESITTGTILGITDQGTIGLPWLKPYVDTMYFSGGNLLYQKNGNTYTLPIPAAVTAGNLLTLTGSTLKLGGTATGATALNIGLFGITTDGSDASGNGISQQINASSSANYILIGTSPAGTNSSFTLDGTNNTLNSSDGVNNRLGSFGTSTTNTQMAFSTNTNTVPNTSQLVINRFFNRLTDHINYVGLIYGDNYAANAGDRWLTDKRYVDSSVTVNVPVAGNLTTITGGGIDLGGTATGYTELDLLTETYFLHGNDPSLDLINFSMGGIPAAIHMEGQEAAGIDDRYTDFYLNYQSGYLKSKSGVDNTSTELSTTPASAKVAFYTNISTTPVTSDITLASTGIVVSDHVNGKGLSYDLNYGGSNSSNDRWLPDKRYVDSLSTTLGSSYINNATTPVQTANYWISGKGSLSQSIVYNPISVPFTQYLNFSHDGSDTTKKTWSFGVSGTPAGSPFHTGDSLTLRSYTNTGTFLRDVMVFYRNGIVRFPGTNQLILGNTGGVGTELTVNGLSVFNAAMQLNGHYDHTGGINEHTTTTVTGDYTVLSTDLYINVNNTANCTITLPAATLSPPTGNLFYIKKTINNGFTVTIVVAGGTQTIDGGADYVLTAFNNSVQVHDDGSNYFIYSSH